MSAVKIGIIGAGSAVFSMRLVSDLCKTPSLKGSQVILMDVDEERLNAVAFMANKLSEEFDANITFETTLDLDKAITDSNFVINSALVGGHKFLEDTRAIGEKHGYFRGIDTQEFNMVSDYYTFTNWNQQAYFLEIAEKVGNNNQKDAWLLQAANPVFEGTTLIHRETDTNMVGFCHGHYHVEHLAQALGLHMDDVDWQVAGVNHGIWLNRFEKDGEDLYPKLEAYFQNRKEWAPSDPVDDQLAPVSLDMYNFYGMFPIGDTPRNASWKYHFSMDEKKKWYGEPWGGFDSPTGWKWYGERLRTTTATIQGMMKEILSNPSANMKELLLSDMSRYPEDIREHVEILYDPERLSGEQHIPFIDAIANNNEARLVVNTLNNGVIKGIADNVACEFCATVDKDGIHAEEIKPQLTDRIINWYLTPRIMRMEWALEAFLKRDKSLVVEMLMRDRRTTSFEQAQAVVNEIFKMYE